MKEKTSDTDIQNLWVECRLKDAISYKVFYSAIVGYRILDTLEKRNIITIIDFSKPSTEKRFYVVDLKSKRLVYNCLVAHGRNSGENFANSFSNEPQSLKSSLGFFLTSETYWGKHGYSLRLDGLEANINQNARAREIVIHGADYVSEEFIEKNGRLGRSHGCPAIPVEISSEVIDKISEGSCLFIYGDDDYYKNASVLISKK